MEERTQPIPELLENPLLDFRSIEQLQRAGLECHRLQYYKQNACLVVSIPCDVE